MRALLDLTRKIAAENPEQEFFVDYEKAVSAAKNPETGEIVPILSGLIDGEVAVYHGLILDGKKPEYMWRALVCFEARFDSVEEVNKTLLDFGAHGQCPFEGVDRIVVGSGESERVFRKKLYGDYGPFEEVSK